MARGERGQAREPGIPAAGRHAGQGEVRWATQALFEYCTVAAGEGLLTLDVAPVVWLGGLPDMSELAGAQGEAVTLARYKGCIRRVTSRSFTVHGEGQCPKLQYFSNVTT